MNIKLGEKIRELRKRDGRKQEDLALALGVTNQAVSRWEKDLGYPDMELLPAIANYFHITIDELFGYDNDRETRLAGYIEKFHEMRALEGDEFKTTTEEQESFIRKALAEFPNEWTLQLRLAWVLESKAAQERTDGKYADALKEAVALFEQALANCDDGGWKDSITYQLSDAYIQIDDDEKREKLAFASSPVCISREMLRAYSKDEDKHKRYSAEAVLELLHSLAWVIDWDWTDSSDVFIAMTELYKALFGGKDYGMFNSDMCKLYLRAADKYADRGEKQYATDCFALAFQHREAYKESWDRKENKPSSPFLSCAVTLPRRYMMINDAFIRNHLSTYPEDIANAIRENPKYTSALNER